MLKKSFVVWLDSAFLPELFLPWREWTAAIEHEREPSPDHREQMNPEKSGPHKYEQAPEHNEQNIRYVKCRDCSRESPPDHVVAVGSNIGFSMIPTMLPNGSFTDPTLTPSPTS